MSKDDICKIWRFNVNGLTVFKVCKKLGVAKLPRIKFYQKVTILFQGTVCQTEKDQWKIQSQDREARFVSQVVSPAISTNHTFPTNWMYDLNGHSVSLY